MDKNKENNSATVKKTQNTKFQKEQINKKKKFREDSLKIQDQSLSLQKQSQDSNIKEQNSDTIAKQSSDGIQKQNLLIEKNLNNNANNSSPNRTRHKSLEEIQPSLIKNIKKTSNDLISSNNNINKNNNNISSSEQEQDDQDDQQKQDTDQFDTDNYFMSDKDLLSFKRENLMKMKRDNSDFEEELINQIEKENKKRKQDNVIEEETDEVTDSDDDDYDDDEEEEEDYTNSKLLQTLEDQQYKKKQEEEQQEQQQLNQRNSKTQISTKKINNNSNNNSGSDLFVGQKITKQQSITSLKNGGKNIDNNIQDGKQNIQQIQKQSSDVQKQQGSNKKQQRKASEMKQQEYDKDINEGDEDEDENKQNSTDKDETNSDQELNKKQQQEINAKNQKLQIKLTSIHLQQQQEKRKAEIEKRKLKKQQQKELKREQERAKKEEKEKQKNKKNFEWAIYKRLLLYTKNELSLAIPAYLFMILMAVTQIFVPRLVGDLLDATIKEKNLQLLDNIAYKSLIIFVLHGAFDFFRTYYYNLLGEKIVINLRNDCFKNFMLADIEFHDKHQSGELLSKISSDVMAAKGAASGNLGNFFRHSLLSIGYVAVLLSTSWRLSLVILVCVPIFISSSNYCGAQTKKMVSQYQKVLSKTTQLAGECFLNIRTVKSFSNEEKEIDRFDRKQNKGYSLGKEKCLSLALHNGMESLLSNGAKLCVLWYGGYLVIQNEYLTSGQLASFILYTNSLASSASSITSCLQKINIATGSSKRLFKLIDQFPEIKHKGGEKLQKMQGKIEFQNVSFSYPDSQISTLENFNLLIEPGDQVAFVGPSGSGKSTIIRLIERFYDVNLGQLLIDDKNIKDLDLSILRNYIGYVSQEPILFSGTIESNLTYGVGQEYTEAELDEASKQACAYDFIHDKNLFPKGYRTQVGQQGVKLSGGQKQRIAIARALLKKPKILIFDEATSALDAESEFQVQEAIDKLMQESSMTIIIIAHRLSTILNCEKIIVLNQGKIGGIGSHYELLQSNEVYRNLIERQMNPIKDQIK